MSEFLGPYNDGYREFPENPPYPAWFFVLAVLIIILDIIFMYILHEMSKRLPDVNEHVCSESNKNNNIVTKYSMKWQQFVYDYLLHPNYTLYYIDHFDDIKEKDEILKNWRSTVVLVGDICTFYDTNKLWIYISFVLRLFNLMCGLLFFSIIVVLFWGIIAEFIIIVLKFKAYYNLIILFWLCYVLIFFTKKILYGLYLLFYNTCDKFEIVIAFYWRLITTVIILFGAVFVTNNETKKTGVNATDKDFMRWFAAIMLLRGSIWICLNIMVYFVTTILMVYRLFNQKLDYSIRIDIIEDDINSVQTIRSKPVGNDDKFRLKWWMLLFNIDPRDDIKKRRLYIGYIAVIWFVIFFQTVYIWAISAKRTINEDDWETIGIDVDDSRYYFVLMRLVLIMYYIITILNRGKFSTLFYLWCGQYHIKFYDFMIRFGKKRKEMKKMKTMYGKYEENIDVEMNEIKRDTYTESKLSKPVPTREPVGSFSAQITGMFLVQILLYKQLSCTHIYVPIYLQISI